MAHDAGGPSAARPWLTRQTLEAIAQNASARVLKEPDGQLVMGPAAQATGLAARLRAVLTGVGPMDGPRQPRARPAHDAEIMEAVQSHLRGIDGPEKAFLPRSLESRHPRAAAQEALDKLRAARQRLAQAQPALRSDEAIEQALRQHLPQASDGEIGALTAGAIAFARQRWTDAYFTHQLRPQDIADALTAARVQRARQPPPTA
ncbi:MAG: hypothetical protein V4609_01715 [Pseudomonadota bacterium]